MNEQVRIVSLQPMRVASLKTYSTSPEEEGGRRLREWAKAKGLLGAHAGPRFFGFDLPPTSSDTSIRGYELWMTVGPDAEPEGEIEIKDCAGGLFAVVRCDIDGDAWQIIPSTWQRLVEWCAQSPYRYVPGRQCLEEVLDWSSWPGAFALDLYLPVEG